LKIPIKTVGGKLHRAKKYKKRFAKAGKIIRTAFVGTIGILPFGFYGRGQNLRLMRTEISISNVSG